MFLINWANFLSIKQTSLVVHKLHKILIILESFYAHIINLFKCTNMDNCLFVCLPRPLDLPRPPDVEPPPPHYIQRLVLLYPHSLVVTLAGSKVRYL